MFIEVLHLAKILEMQIKKTNKQKTHNPDVNKADKC